MGSRRNPRVRFQSIAHAAVRGQPGAAESALDNAGGTDLAEQGP
jgi:hypothetical protein